MTQTKTPTLTADQYESVAWALDALSKLTRVIYEPIAAMTELNTETLEVTVSVTKDGEPMTSEQASRIMNWVDSEEMQNDLRAIAETLRDKRTYTQTEWSEIIGEGIHTGFRKGSDHPKAHEYWELIRDMPDDLWGEVLEYAVWGLAYMGLIEVKK